MSNELFAMLQHHTKKPDCADTFELHDELNVWPTSKGLAFTILYPHVAAYCSEDIVLPFKEIGPLLSRSGKAALSRLQNPALP